MTAGSEAKEPKNLRRNDVMGKSVMEGPTRALESEA